MDKQEKYISPLQKLAEESQKKHREELDKKRLEKQLSEKKLNDTSKQ